MDSDYHLAIRTYVANVLKVVTKGLGSRDEFDATRAAVMSAVHAGVADTAAAWNSESSITLRVLPEEVLARCFAQLEPRSRVRAACVSRAWRTTALAQPSLWAEYQATIRNEQHLSIFRTMLLRSASVPLDLELTLGYGLPLQLSELLRDHMHHIRSININSNDCLLFGDVFAPILETVVCHGDLVLPRAPLLREVRAGQLKLEDAQFQYPNLISFYGCLTGDYSAALFNVCPNLQHLELGFATYPVTTTAHWPRTPVPKNLISLKLINRHQHNGYLASFHACQLLQSVELDGCSLHEALEFYFAIGRTLDTLEISGSKAVLQSDVFPQAMVCTDTYSHNLNFLSVTVLPTLRVLVVTQVYLCLRESPFVALPALEHLTLEFTPTDLRQTSCNSGALLSVPTLHTLVLRYTPDQYYTRRNDKFVRILVKYFSSLLRRLELSHVHTLVITGKDFDVAQFDKVDLGNLLGYVEELYHEDRRIDIPGRVCAE